MHHTIQEGDNTKEAHQGQKTPSLCCMYVFGYYHNRLWRTKGKHSGGSIRKPSETIPGAMTSIDLIVSDQPGLIPRVTVALTHARFWASIIFVNHYSDYHKWEWPILHYHKIMVIYPYHFLVAITQLFSCIIFISYFIFILTSSHGDLNPWLYMLYKNWG